MPQGFHPAGAPKRSAEAGAIQGVGDLVTTLLCKPLPPPRHPHSSCAFIQVLLSEHLTPLLPGLLAASSLGLFSHNRDRGCGPRAARGLSPFGSTAFLFFSTEFSKDRAGCPLHPNASPTPFLFTVLEDSSDNTTALRVLLLDAPIS